MTPTINTKATPFFLTPQKYKKCTLSSRTQKQRLQLQAFHYLHTAEKFMSYINHLCVSPTARLSKTNKKAWCYLRPRIHPNGGTEKKRGQITRANRGVINKNMFCFRKRNCYRCVVIHEKHENVLQYKESKCI